MSFAKLANRVSAGVGAPWAFVAALVVVVAWALSGPFFHFSETWQLVINTGTTIITFLMVFVIQNTQNRETRAIQLKLDGLIEAIDTASNELIDIEQLDDQALRVMAQRLRDRAAQVQQHHDARMEARASGDAQRAESPTPSMETP